MLLSTFQTRRTFCRTLTAFFGGVALAGESTGTVVGKVLLPAGSGGRIAVEKYSGSISGKVGRPQPGVAGVWLERPGLKAPMNPTRYSLTQKEYQFGRSLLVVPRGSMVEFPNEDDDYHNVYSLSKGVRFDLGRYKKGAAPPPSVVFDRPGLVRLRCEIHEHMQALILVVDTPYHTVTDSSGAFRLADVPPGQYTLHAQVDEKNHQTAAVMVSAGRSTTIAFSTVGLTKTSVR